VRSIVVDTGPLVAWFDPDDKHHHRAERWLKLHGAGFKRYTTLAVLTEALHLIDSAGAGAALLEWIAAGGLVIVAVENADLRAISARMLRYRDTPMDFADASLLWLADRLGTRSVLTIDERGFGAFRLAGGKHPLLELQRPD
jgi:hypothetical protein